MMGFRSVEQRLFLALTLLASVTTCPQLRAQTIVTGELSGVITDPSGAMIPKVTITAKSDAYGTVRTTTSNDQGEYRLSLLRPGTYVVSATAAGFQPTMQRATVSLGQVNTADIQLAVQQQTETVEVSEALSPLQTENANLTSNFDNNQIVNLPTPGNDMAAYAYLASGSTASTAGGYGAFSSFGLPATSNMFTLNGTDIMDPYFNVNNSGASNLTLGSNEIQEAVVVTNGYTGQYGRQAGAQVNYITRTGSNVFHGNASWWWNGNKLNANDWFNNATGTARPHAVNNEWAWSVGGPVVKNKLFFFFDQEGLRYVLPSGGPIYIPTTDFSSFVLGNLQATNPAAVPFYQKALGLYAGASGASRAVPDAIVGSCGDIVGSADPGAAAARAAGFGVTKPCARQFQSTVNSLNTEWLLAARVDYDPTDKDRLYFRYGKDSGVQATSTDAINPVFSANSVQPQFSAQTGYTRTISANAVNELLLSGLYYSAKFGPPNLSAALATFPTTLFFTNGAPFTNLGGGGNGGNGDQAFPQGRNVQQWQIVDDFSYVHGRHDFKFGVNFRRNDVGDYAYGPLTSGLVSFNSMTDFLDGSLNNGSTYAQTFSKIGAEKIGLYSVGFYGQDEWKVTPKFSVTLALRLERAGNPTCARNCFAGFNSTFEQLNHDPSQPYNSAIHVGLHNAFRNIDPIIPQPRVGIAYSIDNKTVIRAGGGLFADMFEGVLVDRYFVITPNVASFTVQSGIVAPGAAGSAFSNAAASNAALQQGFASGATLAQLQASVPGFTIPNFDAQTNQFHLSQYAEWNVEIERQLIGSLMLSANYVGNHGWNEINSNTFPNAWSTQGFGGLPTAAPDPRFGEVRELSETGRSNYDGLSGSLKWRMKSVIAQVNYTWSHALDTCSNNCLEPFNAAQGTGISSYRFDYSPLGANAQYGNSDYDIRHSVNANYVWNIPTHFDHGILKAALGGWTVAGTFLAHSGYPFNIYNSATRSKYVKNSSGLATTRILADWVGGNNLPSCADPNTTCYTAAQFLPLIQQNNFGNLGKNAFHGPGYFDTDLDLNKNFNLTERFHLVIGANFFNVLNHPSFDLPQSNISAGGSFGRIVNTIYPFSSPYGSLQTAGVSGRIVQMNAKFQF
jgi:hypothetical protein